MDVYSAAKSNEKNKYVFHNLAVFAAAAAARAAFRAFNGAFCSILGALASSIRKAAAVILFGAGAVLALAVKWGCC